LSAFRPGTRYLLSEALALLLRAEAQPARRRTNGEALAGTTRAAHRMPLNPVELQELELTPERPAAELPETKIPPLECPRQLVEVTSPQRL
jgi:hypothetical protein